MTSTKHFHVGDVLSVTTGKLLGPNKMDGLYAILKHLCGEDIYTHQIPRVLEECAPKVLAQHPALAKATGEGVTAATHQAWLEGVVKAFGESLPIAPLAEGEHYSIDPLSELAEKVPPEKIVVVRR